MGHFKKRWEEREGYRKSLNIMEYKRLRQILFVPRNRLGGTRSIH